MIVTLRYNTPLWVCSEATRQCWDSRDKSDSVQLVYSGEDGSEYIDMTTGEKDKALIERIGNQHKHKSVLEHLVYTFDIDGISRACLQEVARHRMASYSVKSTRYTLKELKTAHDVELGDYIIDDLEADLRVDVYKQLQVVRKRLQEGVSNDKVKYLLPEAYKTSLTMTINARSLQNFLELRTSKHALWEIQDLAKAIFEALPEEHKYLFKDSLYA